jgi:excisionase family DNA binding protein
MERLTLSVEEAGRLCGLSRNSAYEAARRGELPTLKFGRRIVVSRAKLLAMLGEPAVGAPVTKAQAEGGRCVEMERPPWAAAARATARAVESTLVTGILFHRRPRPQALALMPTGAPARMTSWCSASVVAGSCEP